MEINGVTIQMLPAASGDCIYLEFPDPDFRILIDGGYAKTYHKYLKKFLLNLAAEGKRLNLIVKNQLAFCRKYNLQIQDRQKALGDHCEKARITDFRDGINQNAYFKNKQYENIAFSINSGDETEGTRFSEETTNPDCKELNWNIKYTSIDGLLGNSNKRRKERKELAKQWAEEFDWYPG